ncbi:hypothetical protein AB3X52_00855 [Nocardioides sp. DS6]|uniref:Uncharacterized protein n=1 Tax=Nocardioides eburneus TaxID=3231482 RepID=A0ABV3SU78_9ACTN
MKIVRRIALALAASATVGISVMGISAPAHADTTWGRNAVGQFIGR